MENSEKEAWVKTDSPSLDLEWRALLSAVRRDDLGGESLLKALPEDLNWPRLVHISKQQKVIPLLCARLKSLGEHNPAPRDFMATLKSLCRLNEGKNLLLTIQLAEILDLFQRNNIEAIVLKGPAFTALVYGRIGMRQFDDLDILIKPGDWPRINSFMAKLGFQMRSENTPARETHYLRWQQDFGYENKHGDYIEIHFRLLRLLYNFPLNIDGLFERKKFIECESFSLPTLSDIDTLIYLSAHGAKHGWLSLGMICDLAALVASRNNWAWAEILEKARRLGLYRILLLGLILGRDIGGIELEEKVESAVRSDTVLEKIEKKILADLLFGWKEKRPRIDHDYYYWKNREKMLDKMEYFVKWLILPELGDLNSVRFPDSLFFLYFPLHFLRLFVKMTAPSLSKWMGRKLLRINGRP